jgi:pyruvate/2-oxoglutarate/acetoin dehydrogenase E1 component
VDKDVLSLRVLATIDQWAVGLTVSRTMDLRAVQQAMEQLKAAKEEIAKMQAKRDVAEKSVREAKLAVQASEK